MAAYTASYPASIRLRSVSATQRSSGSGRRNKCRAANERHERHDLSAFPDGGIEPGHAQRVQVPAIRMAAGAEPAPDRSDEVLPPPANDGPTDVLDEKELVCRIE